MENTVEKIKEVIEKIRPFLQNDGGDIEFVEFKDGELADAEGQLCIPG